MAFDHSGIKKGGNRAAEANALCRWRANFRSGGIMTFRVSATNSDSPFTRRDSGEVQLDIPFRLAFQLKEGAVPRLELDEETRS